MNKLYLLCLAAILSGCAMAPGFTLNGVHMPDAARSWTPDVICDFIGGCLEQPPVVEEVEVDVPVFDEQDNVVGTAKVPALVVPVFDEQDNVVGTEVQVLVE